MICSKILIGVAGIGNKVKGTDNKKLPRIGEWLEVVVEREVAENGLSFG